MPDDVTVVLLARTGNVAHVGQWLTAIAEDSLLATLPAVIWVSPQDSEALDLVTIDLGVPHRVVLGAHEIKALQASMTDLLEHIHTPYFVVIPTVKMRKNSLRSVRKGILHSRRRVMDAGATSSRALMLAPSVCPRAFLLNYIGLMLEGHRAHSAEAMDYLGHMSMQAAVASVEAVDSTTDGMHVLARLNFGALRTTRPPPWRVVVSLVSNDADNVASQPVELQERLGMYGDMRWEHIRAFIPLDAVTTGEYSLVFSLAAQDWERRTRRDLRPNVGVLLNARPTTVVSSAAPSHTLCRYLIHTTGNGDVTRVTLLSGAGAASERRWAKILLKKDVRMILRSGAPRRARALTLVRRLTAPLVGRRQVWLVGERTGTAQDNGFHLFRYLRTQHPRRRVYYVIDKSSAHYERVKVYGKVVNHSSLRHRFLLLHASVLADAYSISYLIPRQWNRDHYARHLAWRIGAFRVYLKHGVHMSPNAFKRGTTGYDMVLTVTEKETRSLAAASGYEKQLAEVGLPRYDALTPSTPTRTVLFMSTWRRYLVPKVFGGENKDQTPYEGSEYQRFMSAFLRSERLHEMLRKQSYRLIFLPHHNLASYFANHTTGGERISIADTNGTSFQDLIRGCDAFITDHSSVNFDIAYLGTPMIYARFDAEEFERRHVAPSWFNHERDGFGPVTYDLDSTLDALDELLRRNCEQDEKYARRIEATFTYRDRNNCERVVSAVDRMLIGQPQPALTHETER